MLFKNSTELAAFVGNYRTSFGGVEVDKNNLSPIIEKIDSIVDYLKAEPAALSVNVGGIASISGYGTLSVEMEIKLNSAGSLICCEWRV